ncbi:hypothetical protein KR044_008285 [Drosophila immigrans]|nr:hypothetical protein KR044_008285 [Drosophila immigrans]
MMSSSIVWASLVILSSCILCALSHRTWNFEILSATAYSSDEEKVNVSIQVDRISFSESTISAVGDLNFDVSDETMIELLLLHSRTGRENDFSVTPYQIPKQTFSKFLDAYYDGIVYPNVGPCSNLPETLKIPIERKRYIFDHCALTGEGYPHILPMGYYKLSMEMTGEVNLVINCTVKLTSKTL